MPLCAYDLFLMDTAETEDLDSFVVDSTDVRSHVFARHTHFTNISNQKEKFEVAKFELHQLLHFPNLKGTPLLVVRVFSILPSSVLIDSDAPCPAWEQERP